MDIHGGKNWKQIATFLPGKTEVQCLHRWTKVLDPQLTKGPWTELVSESTLRLMTVLILPQEDRKVMELVGQHGARKWSLIAQSLPGRIGKQCR